MTQVLDLTGKIFGRLVVLNRSSNTRSGKARWRCRCECGALHTVVAGSLMSGHTISCGCGRAENSSQRKIKSPGETAINGKFATYIRSAMDRKLSFDLTKEEFTALSALECYFCGKQPTPFNPYNSPAYTRRKYKLLPDTFERAWILFNGIDRLDNALGYTLMNCAPCCPDCNTSKSDDSEADFVRRSANIATRADFRRQYES